MRLSPGLDFERCPDANFSARMGSQGAPLKEPSRVRDFSDVPRELSRLAACLR